MTSSHPSAFYAELTDDRLTTIAELLLDIRFNTRRELNSDFDDSYTRETATFGRSRNALIQLCQSKRFDWLKLASPGMDVTFFIGNVPCRFFRDDPETPSKKGFFRRNQVDDLFAGDDQQPVMWRFIVERAMTEEDEDRAFFIGYNEYQEEVSNWAYATSATILHSVDKETPPATVLLPADVDVLDDADSGEEADNIPFQQRRSNDALDE
tara:strand:- start:2001 stop:2630 length:630 start_codon:yes stop_codon:yes gene_type:complete